MDALGHRLHNGREEQITCTAHASPKDNTLRADHSQNVSHCDPQIHPDALYDPLWFRIAFPGSLDNDFGSDPIQILVHQFANSSRVPVHHFFHTHGSHSWTGGIELQAASPATTTGQAVDLHNLVTEFAGRSANAQMELSVHHYAA